MQSKWRANVAVLTCFLGSRSHSLSPQTCRPGCIVSSYCAVLMVHVGRDRARSFMFCLEQTWTIELMQSTRGPLELSSADAPSQLPVCPQRSPDVAKLSPQTCTMRVRRFVGLHCNWGIANPLCKFARPGGRLPRFRTRHFQHDPRANPHPSQVSWTHASPPSHLMPGCTHTHAAPLRRRPALRLYHTHRRRHRRSLRSFTLPHASRGTAAQDLLQG